MIVVTSRDEKSFAVNPDLIERVFDRPQTQLQLINGNRILVVESMAEVIERIEAHRARVLALAHRVEAGTDHPPAQRSAAHLEVIPSDPDVPAKGRRPRST